MNNPITPEFIKQNAAFTRDLGFCQVYTLRYQGIDTEVYLFQRDSRWHWSEKAPRVSWRYFIDDFGYAWCWDTRRVYMIEAEIEMGRRGELTEEYSNGYAAFSLDAVKRVLVEGGYMEE